MTDLRDRLAEFEDAAQRALNHPRPIRLPCTHLGHFLRLDQVGQLTHITRKGVCNRELHGSALAAGALVEHLRALGYDLVLSPRSDT